MRDADLAFGPILGVSNVTEDLDSTWYRPHANRERQNVPALPTIASLTPPRAALSETHWAKPYVAIAGVLSGVPEARRPQFDGHCLLGVT